MGRSTTAEALLEHGALLFARHGVAGVTPKQLHEAVGARNESAVHYHFGGVPGLVDAVLRRHLAAVEERRRVLVAGLEERGATGDLRAVLHALTQPMADDLATEVGRAHLRIVAELSHPSLAYRPPFARDGDAGDGDGAVAGATVVRWLEQALPELPRPVRTERLALLRGQLIALLGLRAQLLDDDPAMRDEARTHLFVENLLDMLLAGLTIPPSATTTAAIAALPKRRRRS